MVVPAMLVPGEFFKDDAYFYPQIALNLVAGQGSTFHGLTSTNGYHPLWMLFVMAAAWLADGDRLATLHIVVAIQALLTLGVALTWLRLASRMSLEYRLAGVALIGTYLFAVGVFGSEAHLNALTLVLAMLALWNALESDTPWRWALTGVLMGFAILARLDNVLVGAALCGLGVLAHRSMGVSFIVRRALPTLAGTIIVVAPYLAANWLQYGHLMPISGAIKSTFPTFDFDFARLGGMGQLAAPFGLVALVVGLWLDDDRRRRVIWIGLGLGVVAHALYVVGFTDHYTFWAWYYVAGVLAAGFCVAYLPTWLEGRLSGTRAATYVAPLVLALTLAVLAMGTARAWLKAFNPIAIGPVVLDVPVNSYRWTEEVGAWMRRHLPPGTAVLVYDWPGALAYYSELPVVPIDGLVNDFAYNDQVLAEGARGYFCSRGVQYYLGLLDDERAATRQEDITAPLYRRTAGHLELRAERLIVRTRDFVSRPDEALPFAIWRLDCGG